MMGAQKRKSVISGRASARGHSRMSRPTGEVEETKSRLLSALTFYVLVLCLLLGLAGLLWSYTRPAPIHPTTGAANSSVYDRGLVRTDLSCDSVLLEHSRFWSNVSHRNIQSSVLVYVTPWNGKGYDLAKVFRSKFTHVSPVWYQLKRSNEGLNLHGRHDVDVQWIKDVRQGGSPLILPRVVLEGWPLDLLVKKEEREKAIQMLTKEIIEMQFNGIVLEAWSLWRAYRVLEDPQLRQKALEFVKVLGLKLRTMKGSHLNYGGPLQFIFVIPPPGKPNDSTSFTKSDMLYLSDAVDGFSLMTYDYSSPHSPGPNSPLKWIRSCLQLLLRGDSKEGGTKSDLGSKSKGFQKSTIAAKLLMGINFYGNEYSSEGGNPVLGHDYLSLLTQYKPRIKWHSDSQEHFLEYTRHESKQRSVVYYPSLQSLSIRLKEAEVWGVGISIWELGQGLDYFCDLL